MSYASDPNDIALGIYDINDRIAPRIVLESDVRALLFPPRVTNRQSTTIGAQLFDKDFFFQVSTHVVIMLDNFQAISYAAAALGKLSNREIRGLMIISKPNLLGIMTSDACSSERAEIDKCISEGRLIVHEYFDMAALSAFLAA